MRGLVRRLLRRAGYDLVRYPPPDFSPEDLALIREVGPYTLTTPERLFALIRATEHIVRHGVTGDVVECGVWRGGSVMAVARTLLRLGDQSRHLHLFDTFAGMPPPTDADVHFAGQTAAGMLAGRPRTTEDGTWAYAPLDAVRAAVSRGGYPGDRIHFVPGKVEDTIPGQAPERIALLRLDTDWYESTRHELVHLLPRLVPGGVLIIDDYGHWLGARKAVDEYFAGHGVDILLARVDYSARIGVKR